MNQFPDNFQTLANQFPLKENFNLDGHEIPVKKIKLSNGTETCLYNTEGPTGFDPKQGIPKRRLEWVQERIKRGEIGRASCRERV